jgi:hypothetical protein
LRQRGALDIYQPNHDFGWPIIALWRGWKHFNLKMGLSLKSVLVRRSRTMTGMWQKADIFRQLEGTDAHAIVEGKSYRNFYRRKTGRRDGRKQNPRGLLGINPLHGGFV